jgi:hypothetical protein
LDLRLVGVEISAIVLAGSRFGSGDSRPTTIENCWATAVVFFHGIVDARFRYVVSRVIIVRDIVAPVDGREKNISPAVLMLKPWWARTEAPESRNMERCIAETYRRNTWRHAVKARSPAKAE